MPLGAEKLPKADWEGREYTWKGGGAGERSPDEGTDHTTPRLPWSSAGRSLGLSLLRGHNLALGVEAGDPLGSRPPSPWHSRLPEGRMGKPSRQGPSGLIPGPATHFAGQSWAQIPKTECGDKGGGNLRSVLQD